MAQYPLADAKENFNAIMEAALAGETIEFVDEGATVLELRRSVVSASRSDRRAVLDEVARLTRDIPSLDPDFVSFIRKMRDEER